MNRDSKRLEKIKSDRIELLRRVRESISNNSNSLNEIITPKVLPSYDINLNKTFIDDNEVNYDKLTSITPSNIRIFLPTP